MNEDVKVQDTEKAIVVKSETELLKENFSDCYAIASEWEEKAKMIIVEDETQTVNMKLARVGRLVLKNKRCDIINIAKKLRKDVQEEGKRKAKQITVIEKELLGLITPIEKYLNEQENFVEIREKARIEKDRIEFEQQQEEKRIETDRLDKLESDRKNLILPYRDYWNEIIDSENLKAYSQEDFDKLFQLLMDMKDYADEENEKIRLKNIQLEEKAEEKAAAQKIIDDRKDVELKEILEKAAIDKAEINRKMKELEEKKNSSNTIECPECGCKIKL